LEKEMKLMHYFLSGMLCLGLVAGSSFSAEAAEQEAFTLGEIVVTGEKSDISAIGISETITFEQIEATNSKTVADALEFAPGITMTRGMKNEPEVSVHGFGQEKSLFLIDGIPYYETYYGKLSLDQIPAGIISRIEITKNAPSVLYGANAQVAVINVITKQGSKEPSFNLQGEIGENDTWKTELSHGNQIGAVNYWLSYSHEESDGWQLSDDFDPEIATRMKKFMPDKDGIHEDGGLRKNSDYEKDRLWARAGIMPSLGSEYFVSFHIMDSEFGHPPATNEYKIFPTSGDDAGFSTFSRFEEYRDWGIDLSGEQAVSDQLTFRGKLFYHDHEDVYVSYDAPDYDTEISKSSYQDDFFGGSLFADFSAAEPHMGHLSFHYKRDSHDDRSGEALPFNEYASYTGSVGTEHEYLIDSGPSLYAGISYDWFDVDKAEDYEFDDDDNLVGQVAGETPETKDAVNPMVGFTWDLEETLVYGSVAKKTRFPALFELYSSQGGNTELDAEKTINYTLGVTRTFGDRVTADVSGFYHDVSDWISRDYYEDGYTGVELYDNVEDVTMLGFETSLDIVFCEYFKMNANYTYIDAENKSDQKVTDDVIGVPENQFGVGFNALIPKILVMVDVQGIYADGVYDSLPTTGDPDGEAVETDNYFILNTRISRNFMESYAVYAEVDNLFDQDYEEEIGFPGRGRNFRVGASLSF
jgi:iron complex outermembrane receptor protein